MLILTSVNNLIDVYQELHVRTKWAVSLASVVKGSDLMKLNSVETLVNLYKAKDLTAIRFTVNVHQVRNVEQRTTAPM